MKGTQGLRRGGAAAAALGVGAVMAFVAPMAPAVGASSPPLTLGVNVEPTATLVAFGAAVSVPVDIVCAAGGQGQVSVSVSERVLLSIASGTGYTSFTCTGTNQTVDVLVQAVSGRAFVWGVASVSASASVYGDGQYASASDQAVVLVVSG